MAAPPGFFWDSTLLTQDNASEIEDPRDLVELADLAPGRVIGDKYRLIRWVGEGGMASVYEAAHVLLGSPYALKFFRHESSTRPRAARRFEREARLLAKLCHENVVRLLDVGHTERGRPYLVLEYLRGHTLREELVESGVRSVERVLDIATQIGRGLSHAHAAGIVHRDLKPENVMLTAHADGRLLVKVLDFGVARLHEGTGDLVTNTDAVVGTAAYMSPEQARGEANLDAATDVFALGVIVYESLAAKRPFEGKSYNETMYAILNKPQRSLGEHRPDLPEKLVAAVHGALAKDKRERFGSVAEFLEALERSAPGVRTSSAFSAGLTSAEDDEPQAGFRKEGGVKWRDAAIGVLVGAAVASSAFVWVARRTELGTAGVGSGPDRLSVPTLLSTAPARFVPTPEAAEANLSPPPTSSAVSGQRAASPREAPPVARPPRRSAPPAVDEIPSAQSNAGAPRASASAVTSAEGSARSASASSAALPASVGYIEDSPYER